MNPFRNDAPSGPPKIALNARHVEQSLVVSADDDPGKPSARLISIALDAVEHARNVDLSEISARIVEPPRFPDIWPGEHYKLLAGLVLALNPKVIVEIGTGTGLSALTFKQFLRPDGQIATFDLKDWKTLPGGMLRPEDFADGRLVQYTDDLSNPILLPIYASLLSQASIIFVDAFKDFETERRLLENLITLEYQTPPILLFDDIRLMNMIPIWRAIAMPKLDLTSFGHWSGTGLVELITSRRL